MSTLAFVLLLILSVVLQKTVAPLFSIREITPNLILILVVAVSLQRGRFWGVLAGFAAGLLYDLVGTEFVGLSSLANCLAAYVAGTFGRERLERRLVIVIGFLLTVLLLHDVVYFGILAFGTNSGLVRTILGAAVPSALYTALFIVIFHLVWPRMIWGRAH